MATHPDIRAQAYGFFIQEAPELLQVIETELLQLRQDRTTARVHSLMRAAHSIKGGAANVGLDIIKTLAHRLEDCFRAFYDENLQLDDELEELLWQGYDCLRAPLQTVIEQGSETDLSLFLEEGTPILDTIAEYLGEFMCGEDRLPTVAEMGIDIAQTIFETDVAQGIARLQSVPADAIVLVGEIRAQAEVFLGLGELLDLPGFMEISKLTMQAINDNPHAAAEIAKAAISDFQLAYDGVMAGDRKVGGQPSDQLRQLAQPGYKSEYQAVAMPALESAPQSLDLPNLQDVFAINLDDAFAELSDTSWAAKLPTPTEQNDLNALDELAELLSPAVEMSELEITDSEVTDLPLELPASAEASVNLDGVFSLDDVFGLSATPEQPALDFFAAAAEILEEPSGFLTQDTENELPALSPELTQPISSLETALFALQADLDQLPTAVAASQAGETPLFAPELTRHQPSSTQATPVQMPNPSSAAPAAGGQLTVKLELERLDRMNNQLGELAINRNSLAVQNDQLQGSVQELRRRFGQFLSIGEQLRSQLNKMLISPERYASGRETVFLAASANAARTGWDGATSDFDALELDSYNEVYAQLQEAMEMILQLEESVGDVNLFAERSDRALSQQQRILNNLRDELMWGRMLPLNNILDGFPRMIRELSLKLKKPVDLKIIGGSTLVDKAILDKLFDPLQHLLRNAFDHGIEPVEARTNAGKPERGLLAIQAYHLGSRTFIEIRDDGQGLNYARIRTKIVEQGLLSEAEAQAASSSQLVEYLFTPGFSTAAQVTELSGRGVGLDIVRAQIQALKGNISVTSEPGRGTIFTLQIPLTLSITKLMLVWSGVTNIALPSDSILDIINPQPQDLKTSGGERFIYWQNQVIPIYSLKNLLPYNCPLDESSAELKLNTVPTPADWAPPLLILRQSGQPMALEVDKLLGEQELVIKPFSSALKSPSYLYGSTILGDGALVLVVDALSLMEGQRPQTSITIGQTPDKVVADAIVDTVMVVDDSATMRQTLSLSLQKAGYRILQAKDGREALEQLQLNRQVQLVICDIEMPVMNGFEFLTQKRQQADLAPLPVAMLTSRGGDKHRKLAMQLGATAYFTKPYIEQQFLASVKALLQSTATQPTAQPATQAALR